MATTIHLEDTDDAITLAAMLSSLDALGALDELEETVAQRGIEACLEDVPSEDIDEIDKHAADLADRIERAAKTP